MTSLFTLNSTTMTHAFLFTEIEYMVFFTGQQETEQCLLPLVQQVNMLYRTVVFVDKTIQPCARCCILNVAFECRPSEVIPVVLGVVSLQTPQYWWCVHWLPCRSDTLTD